MTGMRLGKTRSLCAGCGSAVEANVLLKDNKVYLEKDCPVHGKSYTKHMWPDPEIYTGLSSLVPGYRRPAAGLVLNVTQRCNLECAFCYANAGATVARDPDIGGLKRKISSFRGDVVYFSGGEPTLREDLTGLVRFARSCGKTPALFTNGILIDEGNAASLKKAGLGLAILSFDTFSRERMRQLYNKDLSREKRIALLALEKAGIPIYLFTKFTDRKSLDEMGRIFDLAGARPCISIIGFNPAWDVGRVGRYDPGIDTQAITDRFLKIAGMEKEDALQSTYFAHYIAQLFGHAANTCSPCELKCLFYRDSGRLIPLAKILPLKELNASMKAAIDEKNFIARQFRRSAFLLRLLKLAAHNSFLRRMALRQAIRIPLPRDYSQRGILCVIIGSFPGADNLDLRFTGGCNLHSDLPGSDATYPACVRQICINKGIRATELMDSIPPATGSTGG